MIYDISYANRDLPLRNITANDTVIIRYGIRDHADTEVINYLTEFFSRPVGSIPRIEFYWWVKSKNRSESVIEAKRAVKIFNEICHKFRPFIPPAVWLDIEEEYNFNLVNELTPAFLNEFNKNRYSPNNVGVYTFYDAFKNTNMRSAVMKYRPLWVAWHTKLNDSIAKKIKFEFPNAVYWQYGAVNIEGKFKTDVNVKL